MSDGPPGRWTPAYDRMFDPDYHLAGDPACRRWAWLDLCHMAAWKNRTRILGSVVVPLKRGELVASLRFLADRWGWSVKKVRDFLEILEHPDIEKIETVRGTPKGTVYRVVNYDTYANPGHTEGHSEGHEVGTGRAQVGHKEQQVTAGTTDSGSEDPSSSTAAAVGDFLERTKSEWRLEASISEWCSEIQAEPKYAGADIDYEIRKCADWHVGNQRAPKHPDISIRNWLEKAAADAKKQAEADAKRKRNTVAAPQERLTANW